MAEFIYITEQINISETDIIKSNEIGVLVNQDTEYSYIQFVNYEPIVAVPNNNVHTFNPQQTGDQFEYKVCNRCNRLLPVSHFQKNQNGKNNRTVRRPSCNECRSVIDGVDVPLHLKRIWNRQKPHMTIWQCPICKKKTIPELTSKVVLDHNHETGEPRAWICDSCNTGLGRFKDNIEVMESAIEYLRR